VDGQRDIKRRLKELAAALKAEPGSIPKRLELAAALREAGRPIDAIDLYRGVAEAYAEDGRLVQAMAVCKGILDVDPEHRDTLEMLATLAARREHGDRRPPPAAPPRSPPRESGRAVTEPTVGWDASVRKTQSGLGPLVPAPVPTPATTFATTPATTPATTFDDEVTPAEPELDLSPDDSDDSHDSDDLEDAPIAEADQTPVGDHPLGWRVRSVYDEDDGEPEVVTRVGEGDQTRTGADRELTLDGADPDATRAGSIERRRRQSSPELRAKEAAAARRALDFPEETKRLARGNMLLDLAEPAPETLAEHDAAVRALDTERMATVAVEEIVAAAQPSLRLGTRPIESGRLPAPPEELTFGDEDSGAALLEDVISGPFPRPELTVEPPPFPLLSELPRAAFVELLARLSVLQLAAHETVLREGEAGDACYLIASGRVRVTKSGVEVAQLGPGAFFGEFAVLSDQRRHASVQTIEPTELLEIRRDLIDELVAEHPGVARTLRTFYRERLLATLLATAPFFQRLTIEERAGIAERFRPRRFGRGAQIIEEGAPGGGLYLILVGEVEVVRTAKPKAGEKEPAIIRLGMLGEGSYFGEMSLLRGGVASATVRATRMTEAVQLPPRDFYEMASQHPVLWDQLRSEAERREMANHAILAGEARKSDTFYLV
jgi:CRP-like cAMP-binding protein